MLTIKDVFDSGIGDSLSDAIIISDLTGNVVYANECARDLSSSENIETLDSFFSGAEELLNSIRSKIDVEDKIQLRYKTKGKILNVTFSKIQDNLMLCTCTDVTVNEYAEKNAVRIAKLESIELMASGIAHDFNNILSGVILNIELLLSYGTSNWEKSERSITLIKSMVESAKVTVSRLRTISKNVTPVFETIKDPIKLFKDIVEFSAKGGINTISFIDKSIPAKCNLDRAMITQMLNNLILNAVDAVKSNRGEISVIVEDYTHISDLLKFGLLPNAPYLKISVKDSGHGIPVENIDRIFDPYFTTKKHGSGLGLPSVFSIVKAHKGAITVESKEGEGTVFTVYLPKANGTSYTHNADKSILFVDDDEDLVMSLKDLMTLINYNVEVATDLKSAAKIYDNEHNFDFIIVDYNLPDGNGVFLAKKIKEKAPHQKIVVMSGSENIDKTSPYFDGFLQKPFNLSEILELFSKITS